MRTRYRADTTRTSDIGGDPDDQMSMVRLTTYANHMDIEGLVATPAGSRNNVAPEQAERIVGAYGTVRDNLELHEPGYPTPEYLLDRIAKGIRFAVTDNGTPPLTCYQRVIVTVNPRG